MSDEFVYINGEILRAEQAKISFMDRGFLYGEGLLETMRARDGKVIRLSRHLERHREGARVLGIEQPLGDEEFAAAIGRIVEANGLGDARVRLTLTRGACEGALVPHEVRTPTVLITAVPLPQSLGPAKVIISSIRRDERSPLSRVKSMAYMPAILARFEARDKGADDAIMLNTRGGVAEATTANVFAVKGRQLITPRIADGALPGVTRSAILEIAHEFGLDAVEKPLSPSELSQADEVFMSSAIQLVRGISSVDGTPLPCLDTSQMVLEALLKAELAD